MRKFLFFILAVLSCLLFGCNSPDPTEGTSMPAEAQPVELTRLYDGYKPPADINQTMADTGEVLLVLEGIKPQERQAIFKGIEQGNLSELEKFCPTKGKGIVAAIMTAIGHDPDEYDDPTFTELTKLYDTWVNTRDLGDTNTRLLTFFGLWEKIGSDDIVIRFVKDENLPDGSIVEGGEVTKKWRVKNAGKKSTPIGVALIPARTFGLKPTTSKVLLPQLKPGEETVVSMTFSLEGKATNYVAECLLSYITKDVKRRFVHAQPGLLIENRTLGGALTFIAKSPKAKS